MEFDLVILIFIIFDRSSSSILEFITLPKSWNLIENGNISREYPISHSIIRSSLKSIFIVWLKTHFLSDKVTKSHETS